MGPPMPTYEGCVQNGKLLIMTGEKLVIDQKHQNVDLKPYEGKWIKFLGYLLEEPTLVLVDKLPSVVGPCRGPQRLPKPEMTIEETIARERKRFKAGDAASHPLMAALVEAMDRPLHSGDIEGRALLSNHFKVVESFSGRWPDRVALWYRARVADNERAIVNGEKVLVVVGSLNLRIGNSGGDEPPGFELALIQEATASNIERLKKAVGPTKSRSEIPPVP